MLLKLPEHTPGDPSGAIAGVIVVLLSAKGLEHLKQAEHDQNADTLDTALSTLSAEQHVMDESDSVLLQTIIDKYRHK